MNKVNKPNKGKYQFVITKDNYEDYSSGRVLYGVTGAPNFPVRFTSELFQRCKFYLEEAGQYGPYKIWDPFCGVAYLLSVLGFLHNSDIKTVLASDINETTLEFAHKNLSLINSEGLNNRIDDLKKLIENYSKNSHKEALQSAYRLKEKSKHPIETVSFQFNILSDEILPDLLSHVDIIISDLPYGMLTEWDGLTINYNPAQAFLNKVKESLSEKAVVVIIVDKKQKVIYDGYIKLNSFTLGKRIVYIIKANPKGY